MNNVQWFLSRIKLYAKFVSGHVICKPASILTPKKDIVIFIGRSSTDFKNGLFTDNVKYLFLYFYENRDLLEQFKIKFYYLVEKKEYFDMLNKYNLPVVYHYSKESILKLLQSRLIIVDNMDWIRFLKVFLTYGTKKLQIWHGVGFKKIELMNKKKSFTFLFRTSLEERYPFYDFVISTSTFYSKNVFSKAFKFKEIWELGYPRNDIFFRKETMLDLINVDLDIYKTILEYKKQGYKIILYAPTYRDSQRSDWFNYLNPKQLNIFLKKRKILLIVKLHPQTKLFLHSSNILSNIIVTNKDTDIYPILKYTDLLITDYSSIYMDYLLLNKPIIFFTPDLSQYILTDRKFQFNYFSMTPGPKVFNYKELQKEIENFLIFKKDKYIRWRYHIKKLAWKYWDGNSSKRIFEKILKKIFNCQIEVD